MTVWRGVGVVQIFGAVDIARRARVVARYLHHQAGVLPQIVAGAGVTYRRGGDSGMM